MIDPAILADKAMRELYTWHLRDLDEIDYFGDRPHLTCEDVLDAHFLICDFFYKKGEGLGGFGPRDINLLSSAVSRQVAYAGGKFVYNDIFKISAALLFGLINNHPFHDANKRTGFLSVVFFLMEHHYIPKLDIQEIEDFTVEIASGNTGDGRQISNTDIDTRIRQMFRRQDTRIYYTVTYM